MTAAYEKFKEEIKRLNRSMEIEVVYESLDFPYEWAMRDLKEVRDALEECKDAPEYESASSALAELESFPESEYDEKAFMHKLNKMIEDLKL